MVLLDAPAERKLGPKERGQLALDEGLVLRSNL